MNINVNAVASLAGTSHAAARGGEAEAQAAEATRQQAVSQTPAGKSPDSAAVDAGDQTSDRDGHGRQVLDTFERSGRERKDGEDGEGQDDASKQASHDGLLEDLTEIQLRDALNPSRGSHLDLEA